MIARNARLALPLLVVLAAVACGGEDDPDCEDCAAATRRARATMDIVRDAFVDHINAVSTTDTSMTSLAIDFSVPCAVSGTAHLTGIVAGEVYDFVNGFDATQGSLRVQFGDCVAELPAQNPGTFSVDGTVWSSLSGGASQFSWWWTLHAASEDVLYVDEATTRCTADVVWNNYADSNDVYGEWCGDTVEYRQPGDG